MGEFRSLLLRISREIDQGTLEDLKYLCTDSIPEGEMQKITSPLMLFRDLERRGLLETGNTGFLQELLENVGCIKLANCIKDFSATRELQSFFLESDGRDFNSGENIQPSSTLKKSCGIDQHCSQSQQSQEKCISCSAFSGMQRQPGEIYMKILVELATTGAWIAGSAFILKRYINNPTALAGLFASVVLPSGILVKCMCKGSVLCILKATELQGVQYLWKDFKSGKLLYALEKVLVTEELQALAGVEQIILKVELDEEMYREVCLELISARQKADDICQLVQWRARSLSDPGRTHPSPSLSTGAKIGLQQESLQLMANVERKRRLKAEKKLQEYTSTIRPLFPELIGLVDKSPQETGSAESCDESDDSSESSGTCDEEYVLEWEDYMKASNTFWSSIPGCIKQKSWVDFEAAVEKEFDSELSHGKEHLMSFLAYVLKVNYETRTAEFVSLNNFIRLTVWFGPFITGSEGCFSKMRSLMKYSISRDADRKFTSWFAGHITDLEAEKRLNSEKPGTFLIRFTSSNEAPGFRLSLNSQGNVVEFPIEVNKETGFIEYGDKQFPSLPVLVGELRNIWTQSLHLPHSAEIL